MDGTFKKIQGFNKLLEELTERLEIKKETTLQEEKIVKIALSESGMALASGYLKYFNSDRKSVV